MTVDEEDPKNKTNVNDVEDYVKLDTVSGDVEKNVKLENVSAHVENSKNQKVLDENLKDDEDFVAELELALSTDKEDPEENCHDELRKFNKKMRKLKKKDEKECRFSSHYIMESYYDGNDNDIFFSSDDEFVYQPETFSCPVLDDDDVDIDSREIDYDYIS